ncbi:hypothetical protein B0H14DRAFT_3421537 [Mycena olivaceomarginata]|nr:hypothetical protein B0H14DRAFT_3421537 [Mycena olivaceomarginata]
MSCAERSPTPDDSVELNLADHSSPSWALPAHFPKFKIRSDTLEPCSIAARQVRLEDSHPSVFDNPAYKISDTGKWLEHIAHGDTSVGALDPPETPDDPNHPIFTPSEPKPERPVFVSRPLDLPDPRWGRRRFRSFQKIYNQNAETRARHEADEMARFGSSTRTTKLPSRREGTMADRHRRDVPIIRAER